MVDFSLKEYKIGYFPLRFSQNFARAGVVLWKENCRNNCGKFQIEVGPGRCIFHKVPDHFWLKVALDRSTNFTKGACTQLGPCTRRPIARAWAVCSQRRRCLPRRPARRPTPSSTRPPGSSIRTRMNNIESYLIIFTDFRIFGNFLICFRKFGWKSGTRHYFLEFGAKSGKKFIKNSR